MRPHLFCLAGLPQSALDECIRHQKRIAGERCEIVGRPLSAAGAVPQPRYERSHVQAVVDLIFRKIRNEIASTDAGRHVSLLFVDYGSNTNEWFYELAFPACFVTPVPLLSDKQYPVGSSQWNRGVLESITARIQILKDVGRVIFNQVQSNANRTSLLLPLRNFRSDGVRQYLRSVASRLEAATDKENELKYLEQQFASRHERRQAGIHGRWCFVDERQVAFVPPGSARHGYMRAFADPHVIECVLSSMFRLGAPYNRRFHYDCQTVDGKSDLRGRFFNCHGSEGDYRGDPHLNIACNDAIREKQIGG